MNRNIFKLFGALAFVAVFLYSCKKENDNTSEPVVGFDKTGMLTNYADNLIVPSYSSLKQQLQNLDDAANTFLATPNTTNQDALKGTFKAAWLQFEHLSVCQFGPAEPVLQNNFLNTFPADTAVIETNIQSGSYDLAKQSAVSQQGFPALDYLFFSQHAVQDLNGASNTSRKKYVQDIITRMKSIIDKVSTDWNGTYHSDFINNTKADVGSPIGSLINQFAYEMDNMKGMRIGWPFGKQSGGVVFADKCEGYYSGLSLSLAIENLISLKNYYTGGGSGKGISDYLVALDKKQLNDDVLNQFDVTLNKLKAIPEPLSASFTSHTTEVDAAYKEVQLLLTYLKTDVPSATGVRITYQDSDGD